MTIQEAIDSKNFYELRKLVNGTDENGVPMAFAVAKSGNLEAVKYVLEYTGVSMNMRDDNHRNILHFGAMSGNVDVCRYLVEKIGMSPVEGDHDLLTPYEIAAQAGNEELTAYFESVVGAPLSRMYKNPIRRGFFPDPSIIRVGEDYYMVNSTFVFFPCIPVSHSKDLVNWRIIGHAITNPEWSELDDTTGGNGYWAPDISYHDGRFYITVTYRHNDIPPYFYLEGDDAPVFRHQIIVSSDKPEGPYSKPAKIYEDGIDPSLFVDDDGRRYMLLNRGARILELNADATERISDAEMLYYGANKRNPEGPHLMKKDGYYYLFMAEGGTGQGHVVTVARSKTLRGTYEPCPYNPIMTQRDPGALIQRAGHGELVDTPDGEWYLAYLCGREYYPQPGVYRTMLGRETSMDRVVWTPDGWPIANGLKGPSALQYKPNLPEHPWPEEPQTFDEATFFHTWMFSRPPEKDGYAIVEGKVILKGSALDLNKVQSKNILVRRQTDLSFTANTTMVLPELKPGQNAGMTNYYDEVAYIKFAAFCNDDGQLQIKVVEQKREETIEHPAMMVPAGTKRVNFRVDTHIFDRKYYVSFDGGDYVEAVHLPFVDALCDEGVPGKHFTGPTLGMYAYAGEGEELRVTFEDFHYEGTSTRT
ncbi:MAG: family 43 glycosylhydrolase [Firmicutes bacterium]|nr:family 43 glycosylhydrolase [Bacillota bacterium]